MACPDPNHLFAYMEKRLDSAKERAVDVHVEGCPACYTLMVELAQSESLSDLTVQDTMTDHLAPSTPCIRVGTQVDQFLVERVIGRGGMGVVYLAHDTQLDRKVALKVIRTNLLEYETAIRRFLKEARTTAKFNHPHIVTIYGIGQVENMHYVALEYLEGSDLRQLMVARRLSLGECITIALPIVEAISEAHRHGVLHRDLKPSNILIPDEGRIRVVDFGLAIELEPDEDGSLTGNEVSLDGTPRYMAPEQWMRKKTTVATDVWAFGMMLHHMLCGRLPYPRVTARDVARSICSPEPVPNSLSAKDTPQALVDLVEQCLQKDPTQRITTHQMLSVLRGITQPKSGITSTFNAFAALSMAQDNGAAATSIPPRTDLFVGRETELHALAQHLIEGNTRLLSVVGSGGMGKTRLVQRFATEHASQYPGGTWFCDLSEARGLEGILSAVGIGLGVPLTDRDPQERLISIFLSRGRTLVVLDNFEHLLEHGSATVGTWLRKSTHTQFVVTTRRTLGIEGEQSFVLEPLAHDDAVSLFAVRGALTKPGFAVDDRNSDVVDAIVRDLDHMALAIELAAARLPVLTVQELHARLTNRFQLLRGMGQTSTNRQATLRATIDWSWALLKPWEQLALAQSSVFAGGFTLKAAEAVLRVDAWPKAPWLLDVLHPLVDHSLFQAAETLPNHVRYGMYASIREYAEQKVADPQAIIGQDGNTLTGPERQRALCRRHAMYYAEFGAEAFIFSLDRHGGGHRRRRLHLDFENIMTGLEWAAANDEPALAVRCALAAMPIFQIVGPMLEGFQVAERVLRQARTKDADWVRLLNMQVTLAGCAGLNEQASKSSEEALAQARVLGLYREEGIARLNLSSYNPAREPFVEYEALVALFEAAKDPLGEGIIRSAMAARLMSLGRTDEALEQWQEALRLVQATGQRKQEGRIHANLVVFYTHQGRGAAALVHAKAALSIYRALGARRHEAFLFHNMGVLFLEMGREEEASVHYQKAITIANQMGMRYQAATTLSKSGYLKRLKGQFAEAKALYLESLGVHREQDSTRGMAVTKGYLGEIELALGNLDQAQAYLEEAVALNEQIVDILESGRLRTDLAVLYSMQGRYDDARQQFALGERALRGGWVLEYGKLLCKRGHMEHAFGDAEAALRDLSEAQIIAAEMEASPQSVLTREILALSDKLQSP